MIAEHTTQAHIRTPAATAPPRRAAPRRFQVIGEHSKVIAAFVDTHDTKFGQLALSKLFEAADAVSIYLIDHQTAAPRTLTTGRWLPDARRWHRCQYKRRRRCNDRHPTL